MYGVKTSYEFDTDVLTCGKIVVIVMGNVYIFGTIYYCTRYKLELARSINSTIIKECAGAGGTGTDNAESDLVVFYSKHIPSSGFKIIPIE